MGTLLGPRGDCRLPCQCLVGRSAIANVPLASRGASSEHASIRWLNGKWTLRDLGSRNGTTVDNLPLEPRRSIALSVGQTLVFGAPEERWVVTATSEPEPCATFLATGELRWGAGSLLLVPTDDEPEACIYFEAGGWKIEEAGNSRSVQSNELVTTAVGQWRLLLPDWEGLSNTTISGSPLDLDAAELIFKVSSDEEQVQVTLKQSGGSRALPSRACLYTLLTLARVRLSSTAREDERGWLLPQSLAELLKVSPERVHVDFHRIRRLFQDVGLRDAVRVIQRHDDSRRVRIGVGRLRIDRL